MLLVEAKVPICMKWLPGYSSVRAQFIGCQKFNSSSQCTYDGESFKKEVHSQKRPLGYLKHGLNRTRLISRERGVRSYPARMPFQQAEVSTSCCDAARSSSVPLLAIWGLRNTHLMQDVIERWPSPLHLLECAPVLRRQCKVHETDAAFSRGLSYPQCNE